jgi:hypothetical protein
MHEQVYLMTAESGPLTCVYRAARRGSRLDEGGETPPLQP